MLLNSLDGLSCVRECDKFAFTQDFFGFFLFSFEIYKPISFEFYYSAVHAALYKFRVLNQSYAAFLKRFEVAKRTKYIVCVSTKN